MKNQIYLYKNKKKWEIDSLFDWEDKNIKGKDFSEVLQFLGYNTIPCETIGFEFPWFELYDWSFCREQANPYLFYGILSLSDRLEDIVFENTFDVLDFLNEYSSAFQLLNRNYMDQAEFDRKTEKKEDDYV